MIKGGYVEQFLALAKTEKLLRESKAELRRLAKNEMIREELAERARRKRKHRHDNEAIEEVL
jgi:hypothetical protein